MSPRSDGALLAVRDLSIEFATARGAVKPLRSVSLEVPRGTIVGVVGESGCGKSTLANAVLRLLSDNARVTAGEILFEGRNLLDLSEREMRGLRGRRISMIFQ